MKPGSSDGFSRKHLKRMLKLMGVGSLIFTLFLVVIQVSLQFVGAFPDQTFYNFYPIMVALGAAFGFERWWATEQGGVNPFHDR